MTPSTMTGLFLLLCIWSAGSFPLNASEAEQKSEYRLLHRTTPRPGEGAPGFGYVIRVEEYLTAPQFKKLVCRAVRDQAPEGYRHLAILFQYRLDSFSGVPTAEFADSMIASYRWTEGSSNEYSLAIFVDGDGRRVPVRFHRFDHKTDCPLEPDGAEGSRKGATAASTGKWWSELSPASGRDPGVGTCGGKRVRSAIQG